MPLDEQNGVAVTPETHTPQTFVKLDTNYWFHIILSKYKLNDITILGDHIR
jgi:hypothetical protein